jgi:CheY-like chemotaxis protein
MDPHLRAETINSSRRVLVVEDEYLLADEIRRALVSAGFEPVGPFATVREAMATVKNGGHRLASAILDINVRGETIYALADELRQTGVPYTFTTGYDFEVVPELYRDAPRYEKPLDAAALVRSLRLKPAPA